METPKGRILVVDDDRLNRIKLSINLEEAGCDVTLAENGAEALEKLRSQPFDTVLLDLMMPVMDGFEVLEHVRADTALQRIPIIVISGEEELSSVVRCIEMGAADYLTKPFNAVLLRARINSCLEKKWSHDRESELFNELQQRHQELQLLHGKVHQQAAQLKELSIRDGLTALYNRRHFDEQGANALAQAQRYDHPLTIMIGDIDFFKRINDGFSHAVGDEVLRHVARLLQTNTRESDIVARYGGEEFVIALTQTPLTQAIQLCEKLRQIIESHPWSEIQPNLKVSMSMGLCADTQIGSFEKMVAAADEKLYAAKTAGRNRVYAEGYGLI
ncbi:MAG TPA: diguanylate cyclase [Abditibacterium sp.]|jgi:diguanylate cyclase (GGDEF)-like protein